MENLNESQPSLFDLSVDHSSQHSLEQAAKWARFLAIVFICSAVIVTVVFLIFGGGLLNNLSYKFGFSYLQSAFLLILLVCLAIFSVFIVFLYRFSSFTTKGLQETNQNDLEKGISSLKTYFIMVGVLGILGLFFSLLGLLRK